MKFKLTITILYLIISFFIPQLYPQTLIIGNRIDKGIIKNKMLNEISGIAASQVNKGIFWVHNDSGNKNQIYAINSNAEVVGIFDLKGIKNRDWEDISIASGPKGKSYIYLADIGDNKAIYKQKYIYRFPEPLILSKKLNQKRTISKINKITFMYPDGIRDAETIMVDPIKKDIYIISKREKNVNVYLLPYPQSLKKIQTPKKIAKLKVTKIVGGDISQSGRHIIIKNYRKVYYWEKRKDEKLKDVFKREPIELPYMLEPQGEGICWDASVRGYYTISEKRYKITPHLYYYPIIKKK